MAGDEHEGLLAQFPDAIAVQCQGDGWAEVSYLDAEEPVRSARCPACARARLREAAEAFVPPRFRKTVPLPPEVKSWVALGRQAQGLYLAGPVGTGKTQAAWRATVEWCVAADVEPRGEDFATAFLDGARISPTVIFSRLTDLLDDFRPGDGSVRRVRDCQQAKLLVLDDLGAEKASEWTQERLYSVIDHRYVNCMPLIVTGNLPPRELGDDNVGKRVASRLAEMCRVVPMTGSDRRRGAA